MSSFKITIPYNPAAKASVRLGKYGCYNPSCKGMLRTREFVRKALKGRDHKLLEGALLVILHFQLPISANIPNRRRILFDKHHHIIRPDADNLEKYINDAMNNLIWKDDSQIAWLLRSKTMTFSKTGSTTLFVTELQGGVPNYEEIQQIIQNHIIIPEEIHENPKCRTDRLLPDVDCGIDNACSEGDAAVDRI